MSVSNSFFSPSSSFFPSFFFIYGSMVSLQGLWFPQHTSTVRLGGGIGSGGPNDADVDATYAATHPSPSVMPPSASSTRRT
jgi:hypothetical protein